MRLCVRGPCTSSLLQQVRDPAVRALSAYLHLVWSRQYRQEHPEIDWRTQPPAENLVKFLKRRKNFVFNYICPGGQLAESPNPAQACLASYDFVGVVERYDESLVLLRHHLNLSLADLVYLPAKVASGDEPHRVRNTGPLILLLVGLTVSAADRVLSCPRPLTRTTST